MNTALPVTSILPQNERMTVAVIFAYSSIIESDETIRVFTANYIITNI